MKIKLDTYIISDTHFGHQNIIKYCNRPEDHDWLMYLYWTSIVQEDDDILHLGDLCWHTTPADLKSLPGNKYLIKGNHDRKNNEWYENLDFTIMPKRVFFKYDERTILFTHYPEDRLDIYWDINIHGHIHNNGWKIKEEGGRKYINVSVEVMNYTPTKLGEILNGY